jgi:hypothetical protein
MIRREAIPPNRAILRDAENAGKMLRITEGRIWSGVARFKLLFSQEFPRKRRA